jgi:ATP-dependent exoDNAse (exonuclease V) beta subunit
VNPARELAAIRLGGWLPWDVIEHEEEELARDRAEGLRVAYVAATRARDLLVVPAVGDDPFVAGWEGATDGWIAPVHAAIYPEAARRRTPAPAAGCPAFGEDSVLERADADAPGHDNVRPGQHAFGDYDVVWWDPRCLALDVTRVYGLRNEELLQEPDRGVVDADRRAYDAWLVSRQRAQEAGARPSVRVRPVTEWAAARADDERPGPDVELVETGAGLARPTGPRFGTLVHATLATIPLDASGEQVAESVALQARILGAPAEEVTAAATVVGVALAHPLLARAREAWRAGRCRRETPVALTEPDGTLIEGVLDLAWEDARGWTVVDFKTDAELAAVLPRYRRQIALYASVVAQTTGRPATAVLMHV